jgi:hypothetical protein
MKRRLIFCATFVALSSFECAFAQTPQAAAAQAPARPPLFLSEAWRPLATPPDDHGAWPASQAGVASPKLELTLHGPSGKEIQLVAVRGQTDLYPMNLWTGTTTSPSAASLRDRESYVDLSDAFAKIRWTVRTSGFHQVRPILKLADGTWLVGDRTTGPSVDFDVADISIAEVRWMKLDVDRVVTVGGWVANPDLRKVDEVGFADLMPGSGHGPGGYVNVARIEVYGKPVKR